MKGHSPVSAVIQRGGRITSVAEAEAVGVPMLLAMPPVAGHRIAKRPGRQRQTLTLSALTHPGSSPSAALVSNPLLAPAPKHR